MNKRKYTFKLKPSNSQKENLTAYLRLNQQLYNAALQERIEAYEKYKVSLKYNDQQQSLTQIRADHPEYKAMPVYIGRMTLRRLDKAFNSFFNRLKKGQTPGFPRFKSLSRFSCFEMCAGSGWGFEFGENQKNGWLSINGVGRIRARGKARISGNVKTSQVIHKSGEWFVSLTLEGNTTRERSQNKACGFDWGVEYLASSVDHDGNVTQIENPRYYRNAKDAMLPLEQSLSLKKRGSGRWKRACKKLSQAKAKLARQRQHDHHILSAEIADNYALFATEKLTIKNMTHTAKGDAENHGKNVKQKSGLNREILDTAPASLLAKIRYKVEETGGEFVEVPTRKVKPSQRCPSCHAIKKKPLSLRIHECDCGAKMPRDVASALVCINWALGLGAETAPSR